QGGITGVWPRGQIRDKFSKGFHNSTLPKRYDFLGLNDQRPNPLPQASGRRRPAVGEGAVCQGALPLNAPASSTPEFHFCRNRGHPWQAVTMDRTAASKTGNSQPEAPPYSVTLPDELRRPRGPRDPGDAWVEGDRGRFWGRFGSAGLLVHDPAKGVLLQHRALWSDNGGTWGLPGGALHQGEEAVHGALREAQEEAAVPPESVRVLFTSVFDVGYWTYTTVAVEVVEQFDPAISDPESLELQWVPLDLVGDKDLHPGFGAAWPELYRRLLDGSAAP
ncbi:MAG: hydrolase, partial [Arthrobacter sp.]|nr:hydrolase [Arthrobacter sp.]